ncbi:hypothetical protein DIU36_21730 [Mucilaginibacter rubeus]|nr:hypothetical protein DIU36_21730 [Mucilaginibacter rubeus]
MCSGNKSTQASGPTKRSFVIYTEKRKANLPGFKQWWQYFVTIKISSTGLIKKHKKKHKNTLKISHRWIKGETPNKYPKKF